MTPPCSTSARSAASASPQGQRGGVRARRRRDHRGDDAAARRPRDERAAQGPRGRGGQGARPVGAALRRVAGSRAGLRVSGRGPRGSSACHGAFTGELGSGASRPSPRCWCRRVSRVCGRSHGPLTCLDGYVWRQATPRDHVCVTPEVRAQTARDNALAPTRRSATSGTFGPDLCVAGFVWREALPGDRVCVTPATWQQVHDDNLTAGARRNALRVKRRHLRRDDTGAALLGARRRHQRRHGARRRCSARQPRPAQVLARASRTAARRAPAESSSSTTRLPVCGSACRTPIIRVRDPSSLRWSSPRPDRDGLRRPVALHPTS